ncbi:glutathione S-transferase family protein [Pelagibius litoralis]|uniref:Glutathione S-transferase family protein n=1 Tax=Pelagibius litoralis TaxID=374515 RepID=A0A967KFV5_9PROT|nr:glutathione S-transferase family protein [Pelagibius litoralis]NIA71595.1 glutathione S-transferase family protein [Pelagibius litoralis]
MKFYNAAAPSPRRVRIFLAEKGIEIPRINLDLPGGETRRDDFLKKNRLGEVPLLELDDGTVITESQAICRYLEALHPDPSLFGRDPVERARIEMWDRRVELGIMNPLGQIARHTFSFFADKLTQVPACAEAQRADMAERFAWLDEELSDGRPFIAGESFSVADITGMTAAMLADFVEVAIPVSLPHLSRWNQTLRARPSWSA